MKRRELLLNIATLKILEDALDRTAVPLNERQVRDGAFVADKPTGRRLRERAVEHADHALSFLPIPFDRTRDLLGVIEHEPERLSKVWAASQDMRISRTYRSLCAKTYPCPEAWKKSH